MPNGIQTMDIVYVRANVQELKFDENFPASTRAQISNDLNFIYQAKLKRHTPLHQKIFGVNKNAYQDYFETRVKSMGFDGSASADWQAALSDTEANKIVVAASYIVNNYPQIGRLQILFHEARHAEVNHWLHTVCPAQLVDYEAHKVLSYREDLIGELGCDTSELGAYGLTSVLTKNISKYCESCTEKVRMDADFYSEDAASRIVNMKARQRLKIDFRK